jgi:hypothetical protein
MIAAYALMMHADTHACMHASSRHAVVNHQLGQIAALLLVPCTLQENKKVQEISGSITKSISSSALLQ